MLLEHLGKSPSIDPSAYVAPNAVLCGDVRVGPNCRILFGAQVIAEGGSIVLGEQSIVLENAVVRATETHDLSLGKHAVVGPQAHLVGCELADDVFVATGACVLHGASVGAGAELRIHAVVHVRSVLPAGAVVPIGWVAVGSPAQIFPPNEHEKIWALQEPLDFPGTAYGLARQQASLPEITAVLARRLGSHQLDRVLDGAALARRA